MLVYKLVRVAIIAALSLAVFGSGAHAQGYPTKPVTLVVPYAAGGATDVLARIVAPKLAAKLGQEFIVDNVPGAGTTIGNNTVARATADGYTLLFAVTPFVISQFLLENLPYDPEKDFVPLSLVALSPQMLVVNASFEAKDLTQLVGLAKADPGNITIASAGNGSVTHLAAELLQLETGIDLLHVPYKGGGPATISVVGGETKMQFAAPAEVMSHVQSGALRVIAAASAERLGVLPDVPTFGELGYPNVEVNSFFAMLAPAGTPDEITNRVGPAVQAAMQDPEVVERFGTLGAIARGSSSAELEAFLAKERNRWRNVVRNAGITIK